MLIDKIKEVTAQIEALDEERKALVSLRTRTIHKVFEKALLYKTSIFYDSLTLQKLIVVGFVTRNDQVWVELAPLKKDGKTPSKQNHKHLHWQFALRDWMEQRDDPEAYYYKKKKEQEKNIEEVRNAIESGEDIF